MEPPKDESGNICNKLILIDALDEIKEESLDDFLIVVQEGFSKLPTWMRLFITSRRYDKILRALSIDVSP